MAQKKKTPDTARSEVKRRRLPTEPEPVSEPDEVMNSAVEESDMQDEVDMTAQDSDEESRGGSDERPTRSVEGRTTGPRTGKANRPPTQDELRAIKEASDLYKSNTFKLAIDALLPNVRPKESRIKPLEEFLRLLYRSLMSLPATPPSHPLEAARALAEKGVQVPYALPLPTQETAWKVAFEKPSEILIAGSWATKTGAKSPGAAAWTVDVAVEMPASLFQEKDYLDCRFFQKKAYCLASLAAAIRADENLRVDVFYDAPLDSRLTSLILVPRNDGSSTDFTKLKAHVRILLVLPSSSPVSLHHLSSTHCNLRVKTSEPDATTLTAPTPVYNADLLMCTSVRERLLRTYELAKEVPSLRDALALLRVWANQRGYSPGPNDKGVVAGFEGKGFFWTTVMHAVVAGEETFGQKKMKTAAARRPVGRGLSSYQLFRAALDFLANYDFTSVPMFVKGGSKFSPDTYGDRNPVLVDTCSVNVVAGIPISSLNLLRRDAKITLNRLNSNSTGEAVDPFDAVFLRDRRQLLTRFDVVLGVDLRKTSLRKSNIVEILDYGSSSQAMLHAMSSLLRRALKDRIHAVGILVPPPDLRPLLQGNTLVSLSLIHIGLILNTENAFRLVEHGPAATEQDNQEAVEFRELWGTKAELRRFKDGRIEESVVWEVKSVDARAHIPADIVCHILARHFGVDPTRDVRTFQKEFDELLRVPETLAQRVVLPGAQPGFKNSRAVFDDLVRILKTLDDTIPLAILNVSPVSSALRYTSVFTPLPIPPKSAASLASTMRYLPSMGVIIQFERSGRWPDDVIAIQKMKLAFYEQMAGALMNKVPGLRASIVTSAQQTRLANLDIAYLEIVTPEGWAFAARIWHDREATLLKRILEEKKLPTANVNGAAPIPTPNGRMQHEHIDKQAAARAYEIYARQYLHAPKHHRAIANLCHLFPAFSGTVRIVKRWFSAHWLFEGHVSEEAIELLCAYVFVGSAVPPQGGDKIRHNVDVPGTKELGFFRVLAFLKEWAWESGLFVSLYEEHAADADGNREEGESARVRVKAGSGSGVWTISTSEDHTGKVWTAEGPDAVAARRIRSLASASLEYALAHEREGFIPKSLFLHPTNDYDLLIRLKPEVLCRTHQSLDAAARTTVTRYANLPGLADDEPLRVDFDPAQMFFNDLKRVYRGTLAFFFDPLGGTVIGAVWDPTVLMARPFRVLADYSTMPSADEKRKQKASTVVLNQAAVLAEIQRLGEGIVKSIEVQRTL